MPESKSVTSPTSARLNKYLASCGLGSRRAVENLILAGQVAVNGAATKQLATQIDPRRDKVTVGGRPVAPAQKLVYILMNKPRGYDVTRGGRHHHRRAHDLLPVGTHAAVQSVGRLDRNSTGLLLFTNDGELAYRLMHPKFGCLKTYEVDLAGKADSAALARLREGIELDDGPARANSVRRLNSLDGDRWRLEIVMNEGRNRIVRRMCEAIGHEVLALHRSRLGPLTLGALRTGRTRPLTTAEVGELKRSAEAPADAGPVKRPSKAGRRERR